MDVGAGVGQTVHVLIEFGVVDGLELYPVGAQFLLQREDVRKLFEVGNSAVLTDKWYLICAYDVIEHIEDGVGAVRWIIDRLQSGGLFLLQFRRFNG